MLSAPAEALNASTATTATASASIDLFIAMSSLSFFEPRRLVATTAV
jgi:hypothetical protein